MTFSHEIKQNVLKQCWHYSIIEWPVAITHPHCGSLKETDLHQQFLVIVHCCQPNPFGILLAFVNNGMKWVENVYNFLNV